MNTINEHYIALELNEMENIYGGVAWKIIGKYALRAVVGAAGVGTGLGATLAVAYAAYEICEALDVF